MLNSQKISKLFDDFNHLRVMIIGDVMIDSYIFGSVDRISPEAPVPVVAVNRRTDRLGGAANVALNIKALGAEPILCSVLGKDKKSDDFIRLLKEHNMPVEGLLRSDERITTTKFRIIGNKVQMLRVDEEDIKELSKTESNNLLKIIADIIQNEQVDAIIFQDYNKGVLTEKMIKEVTHLALDKKIPVTVDPKKNNFFAYKNATLFKPNLKELKEGLDIKSGFNTLNDIQIAVENLQSRMNAEYVFVTLSEKGVVIRKKLADNQFEQYHIPACLRNIADVSGAGDTVISVATLCLALGQDAETIATISNLAGGLVCEEVGVVPISKEKLQGEMKRVCSPE